MKRIIWKGFSTTGYELKGTLFNKADIELIKEGIFNFIFTSKGERLFNPNYGTSIQEVVFDGITDNTLLSIHSDITRAFASDRTN